MMTTMQRICFSKVYGRILLIAITFVTATSALPQHGGGMFNMTGIPTPYNFGNDQGLTTGESIVVDGGGNFHIRSLTVGAMQNRVTDTDLNGVYFVSAQEGWVVGEKGSIYRTFDRGQSWVKQDSTVDDGLMGIDCISQIECWVVGENGTALKTADGSRWSKVDLGTDADLTAVDFLNKEVGIVVGNKGMILRTNDGGRTWRQQHITGGEKSCGYEFISENDDLADVTIVDENNAWIAAEDGVAKYIGGTANWEGICLKGITDAVGVVTHNGKDIYVVGSFNLNLVSHDSGKTWKEYNNPGLQKFRVSDQTGKVILEVKRPLGDKSSESSFMLPKGTLTVEVSMDGVHWSRIAKDAIFEKPTKITIDFHAEISKDR